MTMNRKVIITNDKGRYIGEDGTWIKERSKAKVFKELDALIWLDERRKPGVVMEKIVYVQ